MSNTPPRPGKITRSQANILKNLIRNYVSAKVDEALQIKCDVQRDRKALDLYISNLTVPLDLEVEPAP